MKVYGVMSPNGDYVGKCPCCNFEVPVLYYTKKDEFREDMERIARDERPLHGLCAECFLIHHAEIIALE